MDATLGYQELEDRMAGNRPISTVDQEAYDRRCEQRYRLNTQVRLRTDGGTFQRVTALDFSLNGMGLVCPQEYALGTTCQVLYSHPSLGLSWVEGVVLFCHPLEEDFYIGLRLQFRSLADRSPYQEVVLSSLQQDKGEGP